MTTGGIVLVAIIIKGFWSATRVKPLEQPDNWQNHTGTSDV